MYIYILIFIFVYMTYNLTTGFNLDTKFPIIFEEPQKGNSGKSSYFGFTSALDHDKDGNSWLFVGAPRSNSSSEFHMTSINEPGVLYRCQLSKPLESCREYLLDPTGNEDSPHGVEKYHDHKDGAWIGGAMDIHTRDGGSQAVVCGHRWINELKYSKGVDYLMIGVCYGFMHDMDNVTMENAAKLLPLVDADKKTINYGRTGVYFYGQGQAGISVHFSRDGKMIIGAPGVLNWKGSVIYYKESSPLPDGRNKRSASPFGTAVVAKPNSYSSFDLFGYQVSSGYFFDKSLYYVASGPRGSIYKGKVSIFKMPRYTDEDTQTKHVLEGSSTGEYFGASIAVADVNGDHLDDLIVGAPTFGDDEGCIYVYYGNRMGKFREEWSKGSRVGQKRSRFGTAIASLGDLNQDGYDDIIVGAPYENRGTVYIYNGDSNGLSEEPSQCIQAEDISHELRGFGISFSRPVDIDGNKYADVAVGSYLSGHSILLRSRPVITLQINVTHISKIEPNVTQFHVTVCTSFIGQNITVQSLVMLQTIEVDRIYRRGYLQESTDAIYTRNVTVNNNQCDHLLVHLKNADSFDALEPFTMSISYSLKDDNTSASPVWVRNSIEGHDGFDKYAPVESRQTQKHKETITIPFVNDCGGKEVCNSDLELHCTLTELTDNGTYVIDSSRGVKLHIDVVNLGPESAYGVKVLVNFSNSFYLNNILNDCENVPSKSVAWTTILCNVGNRLVKNKKSNISMEFNVKDIRDVSQFFEFYVLVTSKSDDFHKDNNRQDFSVPLVMEADVSITGKSDDTMFTFIKTSTDIVVFPFSHIYEVQKFGRSPIDEAEVEISVPLFYKVQNTEVTLLHIYRPSAEQDDNAIMCDSNITYVEDERKVMLDSDLETIKPNKSGPENNMNETEDFGQTYHGMGNDAAMKHLNVTNINCDDSIFSCMKIICKTKPFYKTLKTARITLKMEINISNIVSIFGAKDVILSTSGHVHITQPVNLTSSINDRPHSTVISTTFSSLEPTKNVSTWIIIIAVIVGLLLLLLLFMALMKAGFFRRKKLEELKSLKENEVAAAQEFHYTTPDLADDNLPENNSQQIQDNDLYEDEETVKKFSKKDTET